MTVELMRAKPARPRIFNFVSAKINTIKRVYVKRKAHKILGFTLTKRMDWTHFLYYRI